MIVDRILPKSRGTQALWFGAVGLCVLLLLLPAIFRLDGKTHADWQQFLGRFHPLVVHLPIGLLLLVPLLEVVGYVRPALREAAGFVLGLGLASCVGAVVLGVLLAHGGGAAGTGVTRHMWGGIVLTMATLVCVVMRPPWSAMERDWGYPVVLAGTIGVLMWAAHQGGSLTHGTNYLTEYMPGFSGSGSGGVAKDSFYATQIHPMLDAHCVSCHGEGKVKGGLRLDTYEMVMRGGQSGPAVVAGKPERSMLLQRVTLAPDHKGFMPAEGRAPLKPEQIAWLRAWIAQGASPSATKLDGVSVREPDAPLEPVGDYTALMPEIREMQAGQGAKLMQVSGKATDGLVLSTADAPGGFTDAELVKMLRFAPYVVEANLARTAVTDQSMETLAKFTHLRVLHLEGTAVTGAGLGKLSALSQMSYLNLGGTKVSADAVAPLRRMKSLRHLYLYDTPAQPVVQGPPEKTGSTP